MPGSKPLRAFQEYVSPLQQALSCVTRTVLARRHNEITPNSPNFLTTATGPIRLNGIQDLGFAVNQRFQVIENDRKGADRAPWRVQTLSYSYQIEDWEGGEIIAFHWHPQDPNPVKLPHLHLSDRAKVERQELQTAHIPTGRVALEDVIRFLILDFKIIPLRDDWATILDQTAALFRRHSSW